MANIDLWKDAINSYNTAKAEYEEAMIQYEKDIEDYNAAKTKYDEDKAAYDAALEQYQTEYDQYVIDKAEYDTAMEEYNGEWGSHQAMIDFFNNNITSLKNIGRNCTSLTSFNPDTLLIPPSVHGDNCLENFLMGCTSFNQKLIYDPDTVVEGAYGVFKYFMRGCTAFNSDIEIRIDDMKGESVFHGFLYECENFNKELTVFPTKLVGKAAMKRFMMRCRRFNQPVHIPSNLSGNQCLSQFMENCDRFNQPFTLPDNVHETSVKEEVNMITVNGVTKEDIFGYRYWEMTNFMKNCGEFCSTITVPLDTGKYAELSEQSFSTLYLEMPIVTIGVTFDGPGADEIINRLTNSYEICRPYVHITNIDALE